MEVKDDGYNDLNRPLDNNHGLLGNVVPEVNPCPEIPYFGAIYPDARCIDGYLWDLDSDEDGQLTVGGEDPCPFCNLESYLGQNKYRKHEKEYILNRIKELRLKYDKRIS